ncbi:MAG: CDP-alcohol phosphatidyltransferase family protein [Anaerolineae bacterium]|nr:CDP-alcohol phosphatidyltransferase family protein [Anaerolineae bacterium]
MASLEHQAREISRPILEAMGRALARAHIAPNWVTGAGLVVTIVAGVLAGMGLFQWAAVVYAAGALCDALDGTLARISSRSSRFGGFLDSTLDRFEEVILFLGLTAHYARLGSVWEPPLILAAVANSLMVSYTRARAEGLGVACQEGLFTRAVRVTITVIGLLLNQVLITLIVLVVASLFTALQRMVHVWRMTGGEAGGWQLPKTPFIAPGMAVKTDRPESADERRCEDHNTGDTL